MNRPIRILSVGALLAVAAVAAVIVQHPSKAAGPQPPPAAPGVVVAPVEQRELVEYQEFTGRIEPKETVEIRPRVSGYITAVQFASGQRVKKGDLLMTIDARSFEAALQRATGELEQAKLRLELAGTEGRRAASLLEKSAISREEADQRRSREAEARAAVSIAEAAVATARLNVEWAQIRSPIDGIVSRAYVTAGNNVSGVDGAATLLTTVVSENPVHLYADIDEATFLRLQELKRAGGQSTNAAGQVGVEVGLADEAGFPHAGFIESFDNRLNNAMGSILLRAELDNQDQKLVPGLYARVRVPVSARHAVLLVDERAIGTDQSQKFVLSLTASNTVAYRAVKLGSMLDGRRIVRDGLQAGDKIVVNGLQRVRPGALVSPETETPTAPAGTHVAAR